MGFFDTGAGDRTVATAGLVMEQLAPVVDRLGGDEELDREDPLHVLEDRPGVAGTEPLLVVGAIAGG